MKVVIKEDALTKLERKWYIPALVCLGVVTAASLMVAARYARLASETESKVLVMDAAYRTAMSQSGSVDAVGDMVGLSGAPLSTSASIAVQKVPAVASALQNMLRGSDG